MHSLSRHTLLLLSTKSAQSLSWITAFNPLQGILNQRVILITCMSDHITPPLRTPQWLSICLKTESNKACCLPAFPRCFCHHVSNDPHTFLFHHTHSCYFLEQSHHMAFALLFINSTAPLLAPSLPSDLYSNATFSVGFSLTTLCKITISTSNINCPPS